MPASAWVALITTAATVLSVVVAGYALWRQLAVLRTQMALQHFSEYARRYAEIVERLPERIHEPGCRLVDLGPAETTMPALRSFFAICFEEWYLHERGYFDQGMWDAWRLGMRDLLSKAAVRDAWERISRNTSYDERFTRFIEQETAEASQEAKRRPL